MQKHSILPMLRNRLRVAASDHPVGSGLPSLARIAHRNAKAAHAQRTDVRDVVSKDGTSTGVMSSAL